MIKKWIKRSALGLLLILILGGAVIGGAWWYFHPPVQIERGLVYGERAGNPLTLEIMKPIHPNGYAVALMVSGGWRSSTNGIPVWMVAPLIRRGYTVFPISHLSQPEATVMEIVDDVNRGLRYVRRYAEENQLKADRIGVTGGSAGGHLSLMLATLGGTTEGEDHDPLHGVSSAVQAVAIFYPVTDLLNLGDSTENLGDGGPPKSFVKAFGPNSRDLEKWKEIGRSMSPIYHVHSNLPPTLILHGDADTLTPLDQTLRYQQAAQAVGSTVEVVVRKGKKHGWYTMIWDIRLLADWFDRYLRVD